MRQRPLDTAPGDRRVQVRPRARTEEGCRVLKERPPAWMAPLHATVPVLSAQRPSIHALPPMPESAAKPTIGGEMATSSHQSVAPKHNAVAALPLPPNPTADVDADVFNHVHVVRPNMMARVRRSVKQNTTTTPRFRRQVERIFRLLLEDTLGLAPTRGVRVMTYDGIRRRGVVPEHGCFAIANEPTCPLLNEFQSMEPGSPCGIASVDDDDNVVLVPIGRRNGRARPPLPQTFWEQRVLVLDVVALSGRAICNAIAAILERRGQADLIYVVSLCIAPEAIREVKATFPDTKIVTSHVMVPMDHPLYAQTGKFLCQYYSAFASPAVIDQSPGSSSSNEDPR